MDLGEQLRSINTDIQKLESACAANAKKLPKSEIQDLIRKQYKEDMHYPDLLSALGKLISLGIDHKTLIENADFFNQFISPESETMKNKTVETVIRKLKRAYPDQVGSWPQSNTPPDLFSEEVYNNLPDSLKHICEMIPDARKRDVFLIGAITALSAAFSRWRFYHGSGTDVKEYSPHLISLVIGPAGSGKGMTRYGPVLVELIAQGALERARNAIRKYKERVREFEHKVSERKKKGISVEDLVEPEKPPKYCFFISVSDTTQPALVEILHENVMGCLGYESEIDTMVEGNAKEFGGFGDIIRKASHHEPLARQRKGDGESYIVEEPRLSIMLSGTEDQLKKLIPTEQNGLFSRVWFYIISQSPILYKMASQQTDIVGDACRLLSKEVVHIADLWSGKLNVLEFTHDQEQELVSRMQDKQAMEELYRSDISASWLRMGLIVKRIAVTLAAFQGAENVVPENCWEVAMGILPTMKQHCIAALDILRQNNGKKAISKEWYLKQKELGLTEDQVAALLRVTRKTLYNKREAWGLVNG